MNRTVAAILTAGLAVFVLDGLAASLIHGLRGTSPIRVFQGVASGLLGPAAFQGGIAAFLLGLGIHFLVATTAAAAYLGLSLRWPALTERPVVFGLIFGFAVYLFMSYAVVPLSRIGSRPFSWRMAWQMAAAHLFCVGLPISWIITWFRRSE